MRILAVTNMYPTPERPTLGVFVEQQLKGLTQIGLDVQVLVVERATKGMAAYVGLRKQIKNRIRAVQPDIVHAMYGGVLADAATRATDDTPVVVSFCGSDLLGSSSSTPIPRLAAAYGVVASHRAAARARGIVVKSTNLLDVLPASVDRSKVAVIPNGIDLLRFRPLDRNECRRQLGWHADRFHVLFSSNAGNPCKRYALAAASVDALNDSGVPAELHVLAGVQPTLVPVWLNASDAFLLTSLTEGSPNVVKEALACNVPVVSVLVGDVNEQISGVAGCHLAAPVPADLAEKLRLVHSDRMRVDGRPRMQNLSLERVAIRLEAFYKEVLTSALSMGGGPMGGGR